MSPRSRCIVPFALALLVSSISFADTWNVTPGGTGDAPTIQAAIDSAASGDEVVLEGGIYSGEGNENIDFLGKAITVRSASGDPSACVVEIVRESDLVATGGFLFQNGEGAESVLRGLTIRKAYLGRTMPRVVGAGVYCVDASPTIENCVFDSCSAGRDGGGVYASGASSPVVTGCRFLSCYARVRGGGICGVDGAEVEVRNCEFVGNAGDSGAGVGVENATVRVIDSVFRSNHSGLGGGGGIKGDRASLHVSGSRFEGNTGYTGGGIYAFLGESLVIIESVFQGNQVGGDGGAVLAVAAGPCIIDRCTIAGNRALNRGGGVLIEGVTAQITNSILWGNCTEFGGLGPDDLYAYSASSAAVLLCCDIDTLGVQGPGEVVYKSWNIFDDPLFCEPVDCTEAPTTEGDYTLHADSPCLHLPYCFPAGALGEGCGVVTSVQEGRWEHSSWGNVKKMFR